MTAEIAILNKSAIALAADSAVSIGQPPNLKIYNTVNKIFELSCHRPVAIMIYGRLDYMGLPLETIIKEYRAILGRKSFPTIEGYRDDFLNHLLNHVPFADIDEADNIYLLVFDLFTRAAQKIQGLVLQDVVQRGSYQKSKINGISQIYIKQQIAKLKSQRLAKGFISKSLPNTYSALVNDTADTVLQSAFPNETTKKLLRAYAGYALAKSSLSSYRTGLVFAGFGDKELCPSLEAIEMDGIVDGKLKYIEKNSIDIGRRPPQADIVGFAQDDMVKSFLDGIDPSVKSYYNSLIGDVIRDTSREMLKQNISDSQLVEQALQAIAPAIDKMHADYVKKANAYLMKDYYKPITDMIRLMPRQELSTLASSLIEITSLKRKVTREQETVGGEVDVAIISKSEGFVWVKRKHYFPKELNHRFFARHYAASEESAHEAEKK